MKNIHVLPTDKPSRLHYFTANKAGYYLYPNNGLVIPRNPNCINQNICITNDEEIKDGDWCLSKLNEVVRFGKKFTASLYKKIILTTDQDLIKDGVQEIDDEFLEWFVNNPSCGRVEVYYQLHKDEPLYKIIIPQEEPKKEVTGVDDNRPKPNYCYAKEQGHGEIGCVFPACHCGLPIKQETLEEAAERFFPLAETIGGETYTAYKGFIAGAKWQEKRMYSEEESIQKIIDYVDFQFNTNGELNSEIKKWFEQFKKK
jgi:hypothetical protein